MEMRIVYRNPATYKYNLMCRHRQRAQVATVLGQTDRTTKSLLFSAHLDKVKGAIHGVGSEHAVETSGR